MKVSPLRWHGRARRLRMRESVELTARDWLLGWNASAAAFDCEPADDSKIAEDAIFVEATSGCGAVLVACSDIDLQNLACLLAGVSSAQPAHVFTAGIGKKAVKDLVEQFIVRLGGRPEVKWTPPLGNERLVSRFGTVSFLIRMQSIELRVFLDARFCDSIAPPERQRTVDLVPRLAAVKDKPVSLHALLDLGSLDLAEFKQLRPGEIFKTQARLDDCIRLRASNSKTFASGKLVRSDGHRALKIEADSHLGE